jgi:uncharacterized protein YbaP (TraB family)
MTLRRWRGGVGLLLILVAGGARAESSVWLLSSPTGNVYLAGSCHVLRASDYPLPPEFETAYGKASKIVLETSVADMQKPDVIAKLKALAVYDDGSTLRQHVAPETYAKVEAFCKERGYPLAQLQPFRPWMLAVTLVLMEMQKLGIDPTNGVDQVFDDRARKDGKTVGSLETVDEQIGFLTLIDKGIDNEQLMQTIGELGQLSTNMSAIISAWRKGDERDLEQLMLKEFKDEPKLYQALIVERNRKWVKKIEGYLRRPHTVMVIVGVAHLVGDDGLVNLLRKAGYKPVKLRSGPGAATGRQRGTEAGPSSP